MDYGSKVSGRLVILPETLEDRYTKEGDIYQLQVHTDRSFTEQNEPQLIEQAFELEKHFPDLKVLYVETQAPNIVTIQFQDVAGPISIVGILSLIPTVFLLIGFGLVAYILWQVYSDNPILLYGLLVIGGIVAFYLLLGPAMKGGFPTPQEIRRNTNETLRTGGIEPAERNLEELRAAANQQRGSAEKTVQRLEAKKELTEQEKPELQGAKRELEEANRALKTVVDVRSQIAKKAVK